MAVRHLHQTSEPKRVGIWLRISAEDILKAERHHGRPKGDSTDESRAEERKAQERAENESLVHHEKRARFYAEAKGWKVVEVYRLGVVSGKTVVGLPETERMLRDVRRGHISGLIFSKLARLARNTRELLDFADIFKECEADLISLAESIDTSTPAGRLFYTMIAALAQWEREEIAERIAASVPIRAKLGKPLGGAAPFGYQWKDRQLVPDPNEAPIRRLLYELFAAHGRKKTVARLLNDAGHRTRNGSLFTDTTVERLIRDPTAKGVRRANYTRSLGDKRHWVLKPESEWVLSEVEAIVPEELWERCNSILDARRGGRRPAKRPVQMFAGLAFCGCGTKMYVPSNTPKYVCNSCRNKVPVADLEGVFHEQLRGFFLSPNEILNYVRGADETIKEKQKLLLAHEKQYQKVRAEMDKLLRLYYDNKISGDGFGREYRPLEEQAKQLEDQIPQIQGEVDFLTIQYMARDQILTEAKDIYTRWNDLDRNEKRRIIENTVEKIVIGKEDIEIELAYLPYSLELMAKGQRGVTGSSRRRA